MFKKSRKASPFKEWSDEDTKAVIERVTKIEEFKKKIREETEGTQKKKIVIFIDDLDRIPEKLIDFLNSLKIFLDIKGCVFILGCDYKILDSALKKRYEEEIYENYFDKIVQAEFYIPRISEKAIEGYLKSLTGSEGIEECTKLVLHSIGGNPRKIKRAVNATKLIKSIFEMKVESILKEFERPKPGKRIEGRGREEIEEPAALKKEITRIFTPEKVFDILFDKKVLFKLVCIRERWPRLYERILSEGKLQRALIALQDAYAFSWDDVPGKDQSRLIKFVKQNFNIDWAETAEIDKINNGKTINVSSGKSHLSIALNNEKTKVNIEPDKNRTEEFKVRAEGGKLKIYANYEPDSELLDAIEEKGRKLEEPEKNLRIFLEDPPVFFGEEDLITYLTLLEISSPEAGISLEYAEPEKLPDNIFNRYLVFERINKGKVNEKIIEEKIKHMDWESDLNSYYFFVEVISALGYDNLIEYLYDRKYLKNIEDKIKASSDPGVIGWWLYFVNVIYSDAAKALINETKKALADKIKASSDPLAVGWLLDDVSGIDKDAAKALINETKNTYADKIKTSSDPWTIGSLLDYVNRIDKDAAKALINETKKDLADKIKASSDPRTVGWLLERVEGIDKDAMKALINETVNTYADKIKASSDPGAIGWIGWLLERVGRIDKDAAKVLINETKNTYADKIKASSDFLAIRSLLGSVGRIDKDAAKALINETMNTYADKIKPSSYPYAGKWLLDEVKGIDSDTAKALINEIKNTYADNIKASSDPGAIGSLLDDVGRIDNDAAKALINETKKDLVEKIKASSDPGAIGSLLDYVRVIDKDAAKALIYETMNTYTDKIKASLDLGAIRWLLGSVGRIDKDAAKALINETKKDLVKNIKASSDPEAIRRLLEKVGEMDPDTAKQLENETKSITSSKNQK
ncbi:MAG: P-loop NTPase fold protein [Candidatus Methanoperedens sp.]|nr:P-loop NTPase fold protein [Candidatus Methanoperedens sp.]